MKNYRYGRRKYLCVRTVKKNCTNLKRVIRLLNEVSDLYVSVEQEAEEMLIDFFQTLFQYVEVALKGENHANILAIINENMEVDENERN